ncbi:hypothetical protein PG988_013775 [Apiospora saccharicola]
MDQPKDHGQAMGLPRLRFFATPSDTGKKENSRSIKFEPESLRAYLGFLCILWFTWFVVCMFDVRFMTDSIFDRIIRIVQFASMVGFTLVLSRFDPDNQIEVSKAITQNKDSNDINQNKDADNKWNPFRALCLYPDSIFETVLF